MRLGYIRHYRPGTMFWNKRAASVDAQASAPITNSVEMSFDTAAGGVAALITKMSATSCYPDLFTFAFGSPVISEALIQDGPALDSRLKGPGGAPQHLDISADDKAALVAFMATLIDTALTTDPKIGDPFQK